MHLCLVGKQLSIGCTLLVIAFPILNCDECSISVSIHLLMFYLVSRGNLLILLFSVYFCLCDVVSVLQCKSITCSAALLPGVLFL